MKSRTRKERKEKETFSRMRGKRFSTVIIVFVYVRFVVPAPRVTTPSTDMLTCIMQYPNGLGLNPRSTRINTDPNSNLVAVIFTSKGRSFCAGADLKNPPSPIEQSSDLTLRYNPIHHMSNISIPIIGAVKGHVITGGFELALNCDFLIADPTTVFQDTHTKFGLAPCWGLSQYLQRRVGAPNAKYISFTAKKIPVEDAYRMGFVTEISNDSLQRAIEIADDIGCNNSLMVQRYKKVIDEGGRLSLSNGLNLERQIGLAHYLEIVGTGDDGDDDGNLQKAKEFITDKNRPRSKL